MYSLTARLQEIRQLNLDSSLCPLELPEPWQHLKEALRGWVNGMVIIAGQANHGKSSLATNLAMALLQSNPQLVVIDLSLDDDARNRISRYVASMSGAHINDVLFEWTIQHEDTAVVQQAIDAAYARLASLEGRLVVLDAGDVVSSKGGPAVPTIEAISRLVSELVRTLPPGSQPLLLIDSLNEVSTSRATELLDVQRAVISQLSVLSNTLNLRILATSHVRKDINWKNPNMNDIYGDSVIRYYAKAITFVYNDSKERGGADNSVFAEVIPPNLDLYASYRQGVPPRIPIVAWIWKKSKISSFDGRFFLRFVPWSNTMVPVPPEDNQIYDNRLDQEILPTRAKT